MGSSPKLMEMASRVAVLFDLNTRPGDTVLVLTDCVQEEDVWMAIAAAGRAAGCEVTVSLMVNPRQTHKDPPPPPVAEAMLVADLTICVTSKEFHTGGHFLPCVKAGRKFIIMEEINSDILLGPSVRADYKLMNEVGPRIKEVMDRGGKWRIVSATGTDFTCHVQPNTGRWMAGYADASNNTMGLAFASFPDGEFGAEPVRGSGNGVVVWDTSVHHPQGLLMEPIRLIIEYGRVVRIEGGNEARQLKQYIRQHAEGPNDEFDIELSIGYNPMCPITGVLRTDKKHYGKIHTAIGDLKKGQLHIDGVTRKPSITVEGQTIIDEGVIKIPPLDSWVASE